MPPGLKSGANRRLAGEDVRAGAIVLPAGRRLAPQHVALAAAVGLNELTGASPCPRRRVLDGRRDRRAGCGRGQRRPCSMPIAICSRGLDRTASARHPPISASCPTIPIDSRARSRRAAQATILSSPPAACRPARPIMCAHAVETHRAAWYSGASRSSLAGRWRWASSRANADARRLSSACPAIRPRSSLPSHA